ncbi:MAG: rhomboid family intramembrane serine protease [Oscillospiraceae bacterium]|nr:rhomboid family intramembrane serine protease [Oscillospiraceae bacterium]
MLSKKLERFCYKYERYGIKNLMLIVVLGQGLVLLMSNFQASVSQISITDTTIYNLIYFNPALILKGEFWRLVTFAFLPQSGLLWFIFFALLYTWFGRQLEEQWGRMKFTLYYTGGMMLTILYGLLLPSVLSLASGTPVAEWGAASSRIVAPHYVNLSVLLAFATLHPNQEIRLWLILPIKMKWIAVISLIMMFGNIVLLPFDLFRGIEPFLLNLPQVILPLMALLNYFLFFGASLFREFDFKIWKKARVRPTSFSRAAKDKEQEKGYLYKCAVCGLTDADAPHMEFRYCSRCGYRCYCSEHLFNHEHK